ncbi:hypothetical protein GCM10023403_45210 [Pseudonocardia benzenivorans]|nr:hypothetical protein PSD17_64540 [Pseudonocardia sp. D17]
MADLDVVAEQLHRGRRELLGEEDDRTGGGGAHGGCRAPGSVGRDPPILGPPADGPAASVSGAIAQPARMVGVRAGTGRPRVRFAAVGSGRAAGFGSRTAVADRGLM